MADPETQFADPALSSALSRFLGEELRALRQSQYGGLSNVAYIDGIVSYKIVKKAFDRFVQESERSLDTFGVLNTYLERWVEDNWVANAQRPQITQ